MDEIEALHAARSAARAGEMAAAQLVEFAERMSVAAEPAELAEYDMLIAREESVRSARSDAFAELGFAVPSVEGG
ncbi:MAG TPA: hypothetical protein VGJ07_05705 [Rugosimonospora sp.]